MVSLACWPVDARSARPRPRTRPGSRSASRHRRRGARSRGPARRTPSASSRSAVVHVAGRPTDRLGQAHLVERLVGDHQHRLEGRLQREPPRVGAGVGLVPGSGSAVIGSPLGRVCRPVSGDVGVGHRLRGGLAPSARAALVVLVDDLDVAVVDPVQRTLSSPSGVTCSNATAPSRNSSSSARKRATVVRVSGESAVERAERGAAEPAQPVDERRRLLADADLRSVQVVERRARATPSTASAVRGQPGELVGPERDQHVRQQRGEPLVERDRRAAPGSTRPPSGPR